MSTINTTLGHPQVGTVAGTGAEFLDFSTHIRLAPTDSSPQTIPSLATPPQTENGAVFHNNAMFFPSPLGGALSPTGGAYSLDTNSAQKDGTHFAPAPVARATSFNSDVHANSAGTRRSRRALEPFPAPVKPRVATLRWDRERTFVYQVEAHGCVVSRREDTLFVNGTKLLNVVGMTRGRRDGILKTERVREVVKVGPMCLKGVWIPFERAAEIARNEGVEGLLYPLFVADLRRFYLEKGLRLRSDGAEGDRGEGEDW